MDLWTEIIFSEKTVSSLLTASSIFHAMGPERCWAGAVFQNWRLCPAGAAVFEKNVMSTGRQLTYEEVVAEHSLPPARGRLRPRGNHSGSLAVRRLEMTRNDMIDVVVTFHCRGHQSSSWTFLLKWSVSIIFAFLPQSGQSPSSAAIKYTSRCQYGEQYWWAVNPCRSQSIIAEYTYIIYIWLWSYICVYIYIINSSYFTSPTQF